MAQDLKPGTWIPSWAEDATNITVPIASFPELTAAEADGASGDIRKVAFAVTKKLADVFEALPVADRPTQMTIGRYASSNQAGTEVTHVVQFTFVNTVATQDVKDEPA
jgi:hypothetical protein